MEQECITLESGFSFEYGKLFGDGKVNRQDVENIAGKLEKAVHAIKVLRSLGVAANHLSKDGLPELVLFPQLPYVEEENLNSPASIKRLQEFSRHVKQHADAVMSFGIGGSYLGNKVLFDTHCGEFWNSLSAEERGGYPEFYFSGNNIDPRRTDELIRLLKTKAESTYARAGHTYRVLLIVISKSGSTIDTMSNFLVAYDAFTQHDAIEVEVVAVTDPAVGANETLLHKLAAQNDWKMFSVPDGVGGRFSILSEVGLVTAACIGFDIEAFLAGARAMDQACQTEDIWRNPALLNAVLKYIAAEKYGCDIEVFMPYADYLKSVAEWYVQLLAESLGKRCNRSGETIYYGRTPIVAVGTTDMHAQTQQHQDGKKDKVVQFLRVGSWEIDPVIPDCFTRTKGLSDMAGISMSKALNAALEANAEALAADDRFSACITLPAVNAFHLGELLYMLMLSVAYEGELANVNAFDQPGVEAYKRIMKGKLTK